MRDDTHTQDASFEVDCLINFRLEALEQQAVIFFV